MSLSNNKHHRRAKLVAWHRKRFHIGFVVLIILGALLGYYSSPFFFAQLVTTDPDHPGFPLGTWDSLRESFFAFLYLYGILAWPAIFVVSFWLFYRRADAKLAAQMAIWEEEASADRAKETHKRMEKARERGQI